MRAYLCAALIGAASCLLSCAQLESVERGTCGNAIVEPEFGEDCDSFPADQCHPPGSKYACRFACDPATLKGCAEGWGCGSDGVCRQPTSTFSPGTRPSPRPSARLFSGDFDGDGRLDVAGLGPDELIVHYFDDADPFGSELSIRPASILSVGDLTPSDVASDITMVSQGGISVLHGRSDRSMLPLPFSFFSAPPGALTILAMEGRPEEPPDLTWFGDEPVFLYQNQIAVPGAGAKGEDLDLFTLDRDISQTAGPIQVANLWDDPVLSPCDEVVITWKDASDVSLLTPCKCTNCPVAEGKQPRYDWNRNGGILTSVALPPGVKASKPAIAARLDSDSHLDLLVAQDGGLYAAYGLGDGKFASTPELAASNQPDNKFAKVTVLIQGFPWPATLPYDLLAIGQVDDDGFPDAVITLQAENASIILRSLPDSKSNKWNFFGLWSSSVQWTGAMIGDFNGNKLPDIIGWSDQARDIHFLNGAEGGYFNEFTLRTEGVPALVGVNDMDGDFVDDLIYVDRIPGVDDSLSVMFGRTFGAPESAVQAGRFPRIEQVVPTQLPIMSYDRIGDAIVVTKDAAGNQGISIFQGSTDRLVQSPLRLTSESKPSALPVLAAVGDFAADPNHQLDLISIGVDNRTSDYAPIVERLWLVPMQGDAVVDPLQVLWGDEVPKAFRAETALMTAVDLDGTATEQELVILGRMSPATGDKLGAMAIARVKQVDGKRELKLDGPPQETAEAWTVPEALLPYGAFAGSSGTIGGGQIRAVDIDADGRVDVAALGQGVVGDSPGNILVLFPNTGSGSLSVSDSIRVPNNTGAPLTGFAFVQTDLDPALELVLLSRQQAWLVQADLPARSFSDPVPLEGVAGGLDAIGADFDHDGIHDLVIIGEDGLHYHKGIAVLP